MGASESVLRDGHVSGNRVAVVDLPNAGVGHYSRIALVPLLPRYFPDPSSLSSLHALYCSDRVRSSFQSGSIRLSEEHFYDRFVAACRRPGPDSRCMDAPLAMCILGFFTPTSAESSTTDNPLLRKTEVADGDASWQIIGYLNCEADDTGCELNMFKIYSGARLSADSDIGLTVLRAAIAQYKLSAAAQGPCGATPWPSSVRVDFNVDDSGAAGTLCRLFRYVALHGRSGEGFDFDVREKQNAAGVNQYRFTMNSKNGLSAALEMLAADVTMKSTRKTSLFAEDSALAAFLSQGKPVADEPFIHISVRQLTNDSNFPSPANKLNPALMAAAARVKALHDECKSHARAPRHADTSSVADRRIADLLHSVIGIPPVSDESVDHLAEVLDFQVLMSLAPHRLHAPVVTKFSCAIQAAHLLMGDPVFVDLLAGDLPPDLSPTLKSISPISLHHGTGVPARPPPGTRVFLDAPVPLELGPARARVQPEGTPDNSPKTSPSNSKPIGRPDGSAVLTSRREVVYEACRKCPWRVIATLVSYNGGCGGACVAALHDAVSRVLGPDAAGTVDPAVAIQRLVDLKLRGLITLPFDKASTLLYALTPVSRETQGVARAREIFDVIDKTLCAELDDD